MKYIEGMTLKDYLDKCQIKEVKLTSASAKLLISNVLKAVSFFH